MTGTFQSNEGFFKQLDWWTILMYALLLGIGWLNIYATCYDPQGATEGLQRDQMQLIWIAGAWGLAILILALPAKIYPVFAWIIYGAGILMLFAVLALGQERNGSRSWLVFGPLHFQPAELAKVMVAIGLAAYMSRPSFRFSSLRHVAVVAAIILVPAMLIVMEKETGLALVLISFFIVLYRQGLSGWFLVSGIVIVGLFLLTIVWPMHAVLWLVLVLCALVSLMINFKKASTLLALASFMAVYFIIPWLLAQYQIDLFSYLEKYQWFLMVALPLLAVTIGLAYARRNHHLKILALCFICCVGLIFSVDFFFNKVLQPHQQARIETLLGIDTDAYGTGYNVLQSKIAIGSGGLSGKGFLQGTQTKFDFVPEQTTDFIFSTIGEEWGFLGGVLVIGLFLSLILRIVVISERQKFAFNRIYGYGVASCFFFHCFINIGMTMGIMPVIGIPLPFISYGGSSLWTFTLLLFILLRMDASRQQ